MSRYIDIDKLGISKFSIDASAEDEYTKGWNDVIDILHNAQSIDEQDLKIDRWIPFVRKHDGDVCTLDYILPDEDEEILISNGSWVDIDTMLYDEQGWYLDSNRELDGLAWMPLPEPWKREDNNDTKSKKE